jgi:hypothetical protein
VEVKAIVKIKVRVLGRVMEMSMTHSCSWARFWIWKVQEKDGDMQSVMKILQISVAQGYHKGLVVCG